MKKKCVLFLCLAVLVFCVRAQESISENSLDDFDSLFDDATDVTVEEQNIENVPLSASEERSYEKWVKFSGALNAEAGFGLEVEEKNVELKFGSKFKNDLSFASNADKFISVRGTLRIQFPKFDIRVYQLYIDMLAFKHLYLTIGIKDISWGYTKLFNNNDLKEKMVESVIDNKKEDNKIKLMTDVLYDSQTNFSVMFQIPIKRVNISALAMYPYTDANKISLNNVSWQNLSYAASIEALIWKMSFNLFARTYPISKAENIQESITIGIPHVFGAEMKASFLGTDVYVQYMMRMSEGDLTSKASYDAFIWTGGFYKYWETKTNRKFGGCIEYQYALLPNAISLVNIHSLRYNIGATPLGPKRNLRIGVEGYHNFTQKEGEVQLGLMVLNVFPKTNWKNGVKLEYGKDINTIRVTIGTTLLIDFDY